MCEAWQVTHVRVTDGDRLQRSLEVEEPCGQRRRQESGAVPNHRTSCSLQDKCCCQLRRSRTKLTCLVNRETWRCLDQVDSLVLAVLEQLVLSLRHQRAVERPHLSGAGDPLPRVFANWA